MKAKKKIQAQMYLLAAFVIIIMIGSIESAYRCNTKLLNTFKLRGFKHSVAEQMVICPSVRETCCSMFDQIDILQLWKKTSAMKLQDHLSDMKRMDHKVMSLYEKFEVLDPKDMIFYYRDHSIGHYNHSFCHFIKQPQDLTSEEEIANLDFMLPGMNQMTKLDMPNFREIAYKRFEQQKPDKNSADYRYKDKFTNNFFKEFIDIAVLISEMKKLPDLHENVYIAKYKRDNLPLKGSEPSVTKRYQPAGSQKKKKDKKRETFLYDYNSISK